MRRNQRLVYCARNVINNKSYIGWATDFTERKARHIREAELGSKTKFHNAIRKYGSNTFEWTILFDGLGSYDNCKTMERRMIAMFDTYQNGYNSTLGGDGGFTGTNSGMFKKGLIPWNAGLKYSDQYKKKLSVAQTGKKQSKLTIEKRVVQFRGKKRSQETKLKISKALYKPVLQLDKSDNIINQYQSTKDAMLATKILNISAVCRGVLSQAGGFKWKYLC